MFPLNSRLITSCIRRNPRSILGNINKLLFSTSSQEEAISFHRRKLPESLISLSSPLGRKLFKEALETDTMESYFPLSEQFVTQSEPSYCSISSLAMVLNALNHDPKRTWKGVWRWVTEETLQCENNNLLCKHSLEKLKKEGMDFKDFESLGECHKVTINSHRSPSSENIEVDKNIQEIYNAGLEAFRTVVLGQTGDGHFSPIAGYHRGSDSVLILDVARFKYPPYWVPVSKLWESMSVVDRATGSPRGFFIVKSSHGEHV